MKGKLVIGIIAVVLLLGVAGWYAGRSLLEPRPQRPPAVRSSPPPADLEDRIHTFCGQTCHAYPPADTFPKKWWRKEVEQAYNFYEKSALSLQVPALEHVVRYYEDKAPEELSSIRPEPAGHSLQVRFEPVRFPGPKVSQPYSISHVSLAHLGASGVKGPVDLLACDMLNGLVMHLRPSAREPVWRILANVPHPARCQVVDLDRDGQQDVLVADLGSFPPTDRRSGSVVWLRGRPDGSFTPITLLKDVGRVADVRAADFRGTGKLDVIVAVFGWQATGEILLLENHTTDWEKPTFVPRTLDDRHGTIHVPITDLDGDGKLDFIALIAQEHETIVAFLNDGKGSFKKKTLYAAPHPGFGSSGIQLVDLDHDGKLDILYTNGDILDMPYLFKPYHGIGWLQSKGNLDFAYHRLTAMYGVHRAVAGDVLGRGKKDILAVSFLPRDKFPDRKQRQADAMILLEQRDGGKWARHSLAGHDCDHVCCALGDVFGTGRMDVVVGHFSSPSVEQPVTIWKNLGK